MRKVLLTAALLGVMFTVSACSRNKDAVSDESSELLDKPEVTQASTKEKDSGSLDSGSTSEDRYKKIQFGEDELFFPNIAETYRKRGVQYAETAYSLEMDYDIYEKINKPDGMKIQNVTGFGIAKPSQEYSDELEKQTNEAFNYTVSQAFSDSHIIEEDESASMGKDDDKIMKHEVSPVDVIAISFAIYEDFFDSIPDIKLSIYGIPHEVWNRYLSEDDRYSSNQKLNTWDTFKDNNYSECDLLAARQIETTDVYYIDYAEFNKNNRYKQFLVVLEMGHIPCEYSFYITGNMGYVMDEGGASAYAAWKEANKDKFIE